jgi:hypothetical protein
MSAACRTFERLHRKVELEADRRADEDGHGEVPVVWSDDLQRELEAASKTARSAAVMDGKWMPVSAVLADAAKASAPLVADHGRQVVLNQRFYMRAAHAACVGR